MKFTVRLRCSKRQSRVAAEQSEPDNDPKQPNRSRALDMRLYRARMKENNDIYLLHRQLESHRLREFRSRMSEEKKKQYREKSKLRMRKSRAKKKAAAAATPPGLLTPVTSSETPRTRSMDQRIEKKRAYWRRKKQEQRAKMSSQSKRRIREKDRLHKREMRAKAKSTMAKMPQTPTTSAEQGAFESESAKSKAIYRARNKLPRSSEKYAAVVAGLISTKSPRKKAALSRQGITCAEADQKLLKCVRKTCQSLKSGRRRQFVGELTRHLDGKHGLKNFASQNLGIKYKYLMKYRKLRLANRDLEKRQVRSDNISESLRKAVEEHYEKPHISTVMPNKKGIGANASKPKHILQRSLSESYKAFCQENRDKKIGRAKFAQIRPKHVLLQSKSKLYQCLCEACANVDLMLRALQLNAIKAKSSCRIGDRYQMSDLTLCKTEGMYRNLPCIDRQCDICGVHLLDEIYEPLLNGRENEEVCWQQWGKITYGDGKKRVALQRITGTLSNLIEQLKGHMEKFPCHLFQARWQQGQYYSLCKNPPEKSVVIVMDFAENYSCSMQHEVQSAHWYIAQVTLHPMVANYQCECDQPSPVREAIHIITDDMKHDSHAVYKFVSIAVDHLTKVRGLSPQRLIQFSDGCSGQYKSKIPFMDVSYGNKDLGIPQVERHYFGSSHGKNPCDGEGGVVKNAAARAVQSEPDVVISDAMSFFNFCSERLSKEAVDADGRCNHSRRVFFYIPTNDIKRNRPSRLDICGLPGTRQIHSVCGVGPKQLKVRRLSCFCQGCNSGGECLNSAYVDKWTAKTLKTKRIQDDPVPDDPVADGQDSDDDSAEDPVATDPTTETETTDPDNDGPVVDDPGTSGSIGNAPHGDAVSQDVNDVPPLQFQDLDISEIFKVMMRDDPIMCPVNESTSDTHPSRADSSLNSADSAASTISTNVTQELNGSEHQSTPADIPELPGSINLEEYYAVYYDRDYYIGRAIGRDGDNFKFKFMHRHRHYSGANYDWPRRPDIEWIHKRYIIDGPLKLVGNGPFRVMDLDRVNHLYLEMRKLYK